MNNKKAALIVFCVLLPLFLLLFSYKATLFFTDLTVEQRAVFDFLEGNKGVGSLEGYTEPELSHLEDVQRVMMYAEAVFYALLLIISLVFTYYRKDKQFTSRLLRYGGIATVLLLVVLLIAVAVSFTS